MEDNRSGTITLDEIIAAAENPDESIPMAEEEISRQLDAVAEKILSGGYKLILLAVPTSSGKTTAAALLTQRLQKMGKPCLDLSMDNFYLNRDMVPILPNGQVDIESIHAYDVPLINRLMAELTMDHTVEMPVFDFYTQKRSDKTILIDPEPDTLIILEGINALHPEIASNVDPETVCRLYISVSTDIETDGKKLLSGQDIRFLRRMVRDYYTRGASPEKTLGMWAGVCEGERLYIQPYKDTVNLQINTFHSYELSVLKSACGPLLPKDSTLQDDLLDRIGIAFNRIPELPPSLVPKTSLLAEFVGNMGSY